MAKRTMAKISPFLDSNIHFFYFFDCKSRKVDYSVEFCVEKVEFLLSQNMYSSMKVILATKPKTKKKKEDKTFKRDKKVYIYF